MKVKRRKMRKQVASVMNPWNFDHVVGERVFDNFSGKVYDLRASTGWGKRSAGDLTPILANPQKKGAKAVKIGNIQKRIANRPVPVAKLSGRCVASVQCH